MPKKKIAILLHANSAYPRPGHTHPPENSYLIWALSEEWQRMGHEVTVLKGTGQSCRADLLVPHLDLTVIPEEYRRYMAGFPTVLNRGVWDISKSSISRNLLSADSDYDGPVLVKTDANAGGRPEVTHPYLMRRCRLAGMVSRQIGEAVPWRWKWTLNPEHYPRFESVKDVPRGAFRNRKMVVERFMPEMEGEKYSLRLFLFFGDRFVNVKLTADTPIIKGRLIRSRAHVPVHPDIVEIRKKLGFDFGKFDYVVHDGRAILLDVNRTPGPPPDYLRSEVAEKMAPGIEVFFK